MRQIQQQDLPEAAFPGGKDQAFRVFFEPAVHQNVWKHSLETSGVEICGVLVGKWARDADGPFVLILESIRGEAASNKFAEVTFTHDTWAKINHEMDSRFAHLAIVGWYHSHPDFGIFLSDRDRFIQEHFFSGPGQLAYVVDPVRKTEGVFFWREGKPTLSPHYWVGNRVQVGTPAGQEELPRPSSPVGLAGGAVAQTPIPGDRASWMPLLSQLALYLVVFLLGFLLAGKLSDLERIHIQQSSMARAWMNLRLRLGLGEKLDSLRKELDGVHKETQTLAKEHVKLSEDPKETQSRWNDLRYRLDDSLGKLTVLRATYCLTPEETAYLEALTDRMSRAEDPEKSKPRDEKATEKKEPEPSTKK